MKPFFLLLFFVSTLSLFAQTEFDKSVERFSDKKTKQKLKNFAKDGIELNFDVKNVTPNDLIDAAKKYLGLPHCMGGDGTKNCIDCSGLLLATFRDVGIATKIHSSQDMARFGTIISDKTKLRKGDLVFFVNTYSTKKTITHSGIMINQTEWIHTSSKKGVEVIKLDNPYYWDKYFLYGTRIFESNNSKK